MPFPSENHRKPCTFFTNERPPLHPPPPLQQPIRELSLLSVQEMIVAEGFLLVRSRLVHLSRERAQQFYAEHRLQKSVQKFQKFQISTFSFRIF
jgi:hypothetical protein